MKNFLDKIGAVAIIVLAAVTAVAFISVVVPALVFLSLVAGAVNMFFSVFRG